MQAHVGADLAQGVREAVKHYSRRLESGRRPLALPAFLRSDDPSERAVEIAIGTDTEATLEREAHRQHATPQQILRHAVLTYLADLDSNGQPVRFVDPPTV
jgi:hypothetical protein